MLFDLLIRRLFEKKVSQKFDTQTNKVHLAFFLVHFVSELKAGSHITAALPTPTLLSHSSLSLRTRLQTGTRNEMAARLL